MPALNSDQTPRWVWWLMKNSGIGTPQYPKCDFFRPLWIHRKIDVCWSPNSTFRGFEEMPWTGRWGDYIQVHFDLRWAVQIKFMAEFVEKLLLDQENRGLVTNTHQFCDGFRGVWKSHILGIEAFLYENSSRVIVRTRGFGLPTSGNSNAHWKDFFKGA